MEDEVLSITDSESVVSVKDLFESFSLSGDSGGEDPEGFLLVTTPHHPPEPFILVVDESPELGPDDAVQEVEGDLDDFATRNLHLIQALRDKTGGLDSILVYGEQTVFRALSNPPTSNEIVALLEASMKRREMHIYNLKRGEYYIKSDAIRASLERIRDERRVSAGLGYLSAAGNNLSIDPELASTLDFSMIDECQLTLRFVEYSKGDPNPPTFSSEVLDRDTYNGHRVLEFLSQKFKRAQKGKKKASEEAYDKTSEFEMGSAEWKVGTWLDDLPVTDYLMSKFLHSSTFSEQQLEGAFHPGMSSSTSSSHFAISSPTRASNMMTTTTTMPSPKDIPDDLAEGRYSYTSMMVEHDTASRHGAMADLDDTSSSVNSSTTSSGITKVAASVAEQTRTLSGSLSKRTSYPDLRAASNLDDIEAHPFLEDVYTQAFQI